jgi:RimJ/RimL family protein N-acetyltransferase
MPTLFPNPYRLDDAHAWVALRSTTVPATHFGIETDGILAGGIGIEPGGVDRAGTAFVGYWLGRRFWGRGIAATALSIFTGYAFERFGVHRLWANVMSPNARSAKVLQKAGFTHEATLRRAIVDRYGEVHDELIFALLRPDGEEERSA